MGKAYKCDVCGAYFDRVDTTFWFGEKPNTGSALPIRFDDDFEHAFLSDPDYNYMVMCPSCTATFLNQMVLFIQEARDEQ